ncbi:hypothetical protein CH272_04445 [Rhodococcus sp. 05-340-1]|nr:hypothetical protein CH271_26340 [Rhodococcus sp. 05-340-2]OZD82473.1 hypothetical protein CH272_04445 [Rhodococcus sp. 05-340-1]
MNSAYQLEETDLITRTFRGSTDSSEPAAVFDSIVAATILSQRSRQPLGSLMFVGDLTQLVPALVCDGNDLASELLRKCVRHGRSSNLRRDSQR